MLGLARDVIDSFRILFVKNDLNTSLVFENKEGKKVNFIHWIIEETARETVEDWQDKQILIGLRNMVQFHGKNCRGNFTSLGGLQRFHINTNLLSWIGLECGTDGNSIHEKTNSFHHTCDMLL